MWSRLLASRRVPLAAAVGTFAVVAAGLLALDVAGLALAHLLYAPVAVVALRAGAGPGAAAGLAATALLALAGVADPRLDGAELLATVLVAGAAFAGTGVVAGRLAARNRLLLDELDRLSERDPLTGLSGARAFHRALEGRCAVGDDSFALVLADVDGLKEVNDADGHAAGDDLIRRAGHALAAETREADLVARVGGDELAVLTTVRKPAEAAGLASRLERALGASGVQITTGWALRRPDDDPASIFRRAESRLAGAKADRKAGGGKVIALPLRDAGG